MLLYLIVGRTASGKSNFANLLANNSLKRVITTTTRPKRANETDHDYHFVSDEQAKNAESKLAPTIINNHQYYIDRQDLRDKDFAIVDPDGVISLAKALPNSIFHIIYLNCDTATRKKLFIKRAVANGSSKQDAENEFEQRDSAENKRFTEFERVLNAQNAKSPYDITDSPYALPKNIYAIMQYNFDYNKPLNMLEKANNLVTDKTIRTRLANLVRKAPQLGLIQVDANGYLIARTHKQGEKTQHQRKMTPELYAEHLLDNVSSFSIFMTQMLAHDNDLDQIYPSHSANLKED